MKTQTKPKSKFRGFYTALALSLVMIGAACVFAYRQTSQTLEQNLNSLSEQMEVTTTATLPYDRKRLHRRQNRKKHPCTS